MELVEVDVMLQHSSRFPRLSSARALLTLPLAAAIAFAGLIIPVRPVLAVSELLEAVKKDPELARSLCNRFKELNANGISATSPPAIAEVAKLKGLSQVDAEVFATYVIGLHCSDVF